MLSDSAAALYDGGWRAEDREQLIEEYQLTEDEADALCRELARCGTQFYGLVIDGLHALPTKLTKRYDTYQEAHEAAERLCKKTYGARGTIEVGMVEMEE